MSSLPLPTSTTTAPSASLAGQSTVALLPGHDESAAASRHRQNAVGDIVIPLERGEIVALPRLWDFALTASAAGRAMLTSSDGLHATVTFADDTAVVVYIADAVGHARDAA